jgi:uncharacterized protein YaaW (UPF0174 family)
MPRDDVLWRRLEAARPVELHRLCEIVGVADYRDEPPPVLVKELSEAIRSAAGHSWLNVFRGAHDFPYKQMLIDVADKVAPGWTFLAWTPYTLNDRHSEIDVEETIWCFFERRMEEQIKSLPEGAREQLRKDTERELRGLGYSQALVSQVGTALVAGAAAGAVAPALAYSLALSTASGLAWLKLWWAGHATAAAVLGTGGGLFALLYLPALGWWLGNTAYRKTVPAALHLIQIRKLREIEATLSPETPSG